MISLTSEYALRAMIYLARHRDEWPISGPRIAEEADIPRKYLSTILADLVRAGLLAGTRGKSGGFQFTRAARQIHLAEIIHPFEPVLENRRKCPFGNETCSDVNPCGAHDSWKAVKGAMEDFLARTTLQQLAAKRGDHAEGKTRPRSAR
ncbi:MAG: Rrf2 family transcriptional regulator [Planctomycetes bacterium]|nr:Rrf2 family transcriptional regulator [Planctomycetota bacterium]MBI3834866.1 Rrf2 family transcriptional regulator [Planctomycetota bacterium]